MHAMMTTVDADPSSTVERRDVVIVIYHACRMLLTVPLRDLVDDLCQDGGANPIIVQALRDAADRMEHVLAPPVQGAKP